MFYRMTCTFSSIKIRNFSCISGVFFVFFILGQVIGGWGKEREEGIMGKLVEKGEGGGRNRGEREDRVGGMVTSYHLEGIAKEKALIFTYSIT